MSRVMPQKELDSVSHARRTLGDNRAFEVLWQAQQYWLAMETFRRDRERNKNYSYGRQWDDYVCMNGKIIMKKLSKNIEIYLQGCSAKQKTKSYYFNLEIFSYLCAVTLPKWFCDGTY